VAEYVARGFAFDAATERVTVQRAGFFGIFTEVPDKVQPPRTFQDFLADDLIEMMLDAFTLAPFFAVTIGFT